MTDNNVINLWGDVPEMDLEKAEEAARQRYRAALEKFEREDFDFHQSGRQQIERLRDLCDGMGNIPYKFEGGIVFGPASVFIDAIEERLFSGLAVLNFDEDSTPPLAEVIPLKRSIKPKKPKSPETIGAVPIPRELSPEEREERRIKREAAKTERIRQREAHLAFLRSEYGDDQAKAYAALMGWR